MRDFCKVSPKVWRSLKFKSLSARGRLLYLYLLTCPHVNAVGCYTLPMAYLGADLGFDDADAVMGEVRKAGMVRYDDAEAIVFVENFIHFNPPTNANHARMMLKQAEELKKTPFFKDLLEKLQIECQDKDWKGLDSVFESLSKAFGKGIERLAPQDQTRPDSTETRPSPPPAARSSPSAGLGVGEAFFDGEVNNPAFKRVSAAVPMPPQKVEGFDVIPLLSEEALAKAKRNAPRWDIHALARKYNAWIINDVGPPNISVNLAFPAWVLKITGGKPPP